MLTLGYRSVSFGYERKHLVLRDFQHEFSAGSTLLLGPNGAGKTTLLALGASVLRPSSGMVAFGDTVASGETLMTYRKQVAWMPQQIRPMPGLTVREQVAYVGWLKGLSREEAWQRSLYALEQVNLVSYAGRRPGRLSGGELRRVGVAQTLVHNAKLVLMDEPTAGLDPAQRADFQRLIVDLRKTVNLVISTHQTEDINQSYDRVVVLDAGKIRFSGTTPEFLELGRDTEEPREQVVLSYRRALALEGKDL